MTVKSVNVRENLVVDGDIYLLAIASPETLTPRKVWRQSGTGKEIKLEQTDEIRLDSQGRRWFDARDAFVILGDDRADKRTVIWLLEQPKSIEVGKTYKATKTLVHIKYGGTIELVIEAIEPYTAPAKEFKPGL